MVTGYCENCGQPIHDGDAFCMNCGTKVATAAAPEGQQGNSVSMSSLVTNQPSPSVCPSCGMPVVEGDMFCMNCGTKIVGSNAPAQAEAPASIPMTSAIGGQPAGNVCQNCGGPLAEGDMFCMNCGTKVTDAQGASEQPAASNGFEGISEDGFCPECGSKTWAGWAFCMSCGHTLNYTFPANQAGASQVPQQPGYYGAGGLDMGSVVAPVEPQASPMQSEYVPAQPVMPTEPAFKPVQPVAPVQPDVSFAGPEVTQPTNEPSAVNVRTVSISGFEDDYVDSILDSGLGWDKTDGGYDPNDEPDDAPTTVYDEDEDDDDVLTMVYSDEVHPTCVIKRISTGDVFTLEMPAKLGRGTAATVRIKGNPFVGRVHAQIVEHDGQVFVIDEGSANHTFVNGTELAPHEEHPLANGDVLALAKEEFSVEIS